MLTTDPQAEYHPEKLTPAPPLAVGEGQGADEPFDAEAFNRRVQERTAAGRKGFDERTAPNGDSIMDVGVARFMVACNNPKHEPYFSMIEALVLAYDAEKARAAALSGQLQDTEAAAGMKDVEIADLRKRNALLADDNGSLEKKATTLAARLKEEEAKHGEEVLGILRDMRQPRLALPSEEGWEYDVICGQNIERKAINDYCRAKAFEYSPEGIGPDPTEQEKPAVSAPPRAEEPREGVARG